MIKTALVLVAALALPSSAQFRNKAFGEGGGYKHPDQNVGGFLEEAPRQGPAIAKPLPEPISTAKPVGAISPAPAIPSRPRPIPFSSELPKADAPSRNESPRPGNSARDSSAFASPAKTAPAEDDDSEGARRDYESKILGAPAEAARPRLGGAEFPPAPGSAEPSPVPSEEGLLFVSLELDASEAGSLRDAVAGLGMSAAFRPDARFAPTAADGGMRISGWVPASRLGDAIASPGVRRVAVERGSRPAPDSRLSGSFLVTLRVADAAKPEESVAEAVRGLSAKTGFKLDRVYGVETAPGAAPTALVSGTFPLSSLSRAMGLPEVVRITAAEASPATAAAPAAPRAGFLSFVMNRALWLVLLTLLLALPTIGEMVRKGLSVFVPYR
ncbi:MAG: hypothetical protein M0D55_14390 [Elusimicrobiota bacterium]|nr:MAG: hypothetical protein M0D55_14390 [Elusimicrobiota bacterium]